MTHRRFAITLALLVAGTLRAEEPYPLLIKDTFLEMESLSSPTISPDGKQIVFSRTWVDKTNDRYASNLWIVDVRGERVRELTSGNWRDGSPVWAPDGKRIAFVSDKDGTNQVHVLWIETRETAQLTHLERAVSDLVWSPDGKRLAFTSFVPDTRPALTVKLPGRPKGAKWAEPATVIDRLNWRRDGRGFVEEGYTHVFVIDAILGGTPRQVTTGDFNHTEVQWAANGRSLYVSGIRKPDADYLRNDSEIYRVNLASLDVDVLTDRKGPDRQPKISPDGKWIAYSGYDDRHYTSHLSNLYLMDSQGQGKRILASDLPSSPRSVTWAADSSGLFYILGEQGSYNIHSVSLDGTGNQLTRAIHALTGFSVSANGQVATVMSDFHRPGYLVTFNIADPDHRSELVDVNADVMEGIQLGEVEELWFTAPDGLKVQGWLIQPARFDPARKYPLLLWIHGGPWSMYSVGFNWAFQNFSAHGYAVLYSNPRGSTGYGQDFVNGIQYAYPGKDYDDLMAGVDAALAKGWIDERNLFVCGGSGGGVLTAWIVGHTDRFAAAVSMRPVINWHSFVGTTDGASWYDQFQKYPWEDPMEYAVRSPLHYVAKVTTPTMVMTGESDLRTPISQSEEYYRALKRLKKETLLVRVPGEYHGWRRPSNRLSQQLYLQAWFDKHRKE